MNKEVIRKDTKHNPYPKYKPSGVEWLGDVPEHWEVKRAGLAFSIQLGKMLQPDTSASEDEQFEYLKALHVQWEKVQTNDLPVMWASKYELDKYSVQKGDLLVCEGGEVGRAGILKDDLNNVIIQNSLHRVRSKNNLNAFLMYVLENAASKNWFEILCNKATIAHFTGDKFSALRIPIPPLPEQRAIAAYLNRETGRIDALIAKKQRLLSLLSEQRTALISRTVTKGLDGSVKLKPSGVEWLGDVPENWVALPLKRIVAIPVTDGPHETPEILDEGIPFISAEAIRSNKIDFSRKRGFISESEHRRFCLKYHPKRDDIYMIKSGATTGNLAIVETDEEFSIWSPLAVVRVHNNKADARFVLAAMNSKEFQTSVQLFWSFGTQQNIGMNVIENLPIPLPPLPEQQAIAAFLDRELVKIDALSDKVTTVIEKLKEYRTALISSAVSGKIDVSTTLNISIGETE